MWVFGSAGVYFAVDHWVTCSVYTSDYLDMTGQKLSDLNKEMHLNSWHDLSWTSVSKILFFSSRNRNCVAHPSDSTVEPLPSLVPDCYAPLVFWFCLSFCCFFLFCHAHSTMLQICNIKLLFLLLIIIVEIMIILTIWGENDKYLLWFVFPKGVLIHKSISRQMSN